MNKMDILATAIVCAHIDSKHAVGSLTWAKDIANALVLLGLKESPERLDRVRLELDVSTSLAQGQVKEIAALIPRAAFADSLLAVYRGQFEDRVREAGYGEIDLVRDGDGEYKHQAVKAAWDAVMKFVHLNDPPIDLPVCRPGAC